MRGYSVHDLYTKALALLGLGVLAGAGALVDYWPSTTGLGLPRPAGAVAALPRRTPVAATPVEAVGIDAAPPSTTPRPRAGATLTMATANVAAPALSLPLPVLMPSGALGTNMPIAPVAMEGVLVFAQQAIPEYVPAMVLPEPSEPTYSVVDHPAAPATQALDDDDDGPITGAFRKTGASIRNTTVKTGSSIVGALRGVSGAVRRALPVL